MSFLCNLETFRDVLKFLWDVCFFFTLFASRALRKQQKKTIFHGMYIVGDYNPEVLQFASRGRLVETTMNSFALQIKSETLLTPKKRTYGNWSHRKPNKQPRHPNTS